MHPRVLRAVVTAAVAATSDYSRKNLLSGSELVRSCSEDDLVERIVNALAQWDDQQEDEASG